MIDFRKLHKKASRANGLMGRVANQRFTAQEVGQKLSGNKGAARKGATKGKRKRRGPVR